MEPDMDHLCGSACITKHMKCWRNTTSTNTKIFWNKDDNYLKAMSDIRWNESGTMQDNKIELEDHTCTATREKEVGTRSHGSFLWIQKVFKDHWIFEVTLKMRSKHAKYCITNLLRSLEVETNLSLQSNKSDKGLINNLKALRNTIIGLMSIQDGDTILLPQRIHLRHHDGNQAATCGQLGTGTRGSLYPGVNSDFFIVPDESFVFRLPVNLNYWQSTGVKQYIYRAHVFLMRILSACLSQLAVTVVQVDTATLSRTDPTHRVAQDRGAHCLCLTQTRHISSRNGIRYTSLEHHTYTGRMHSFLIFDTIFLTSTFQPASTLHRSTTSSEWRFGWAPCFTCWEPKQLADHKDHMHFTEDNQLAEYQDLAEHEDLRAKPLFFHRPSIASTYDSAESVVTPLPDSDFDDEQLRLLASPLYLQERRASAERSQVYHSERGTWCPIHLKIRQVQGYLSQCFLARIGWMKTHFPIETNFPQDIYSL